MSILNNIALELSDFHRDRIRAIDEFDYSKVKKKVARDLQGLTGRYLDEGIENLKMYYVVALLDPLNAHAVSRSVDPFWHAHVLFTRDYAKFCRDAYDYFVHHEPLNPDDQHQVSNVETLYRYTVSRNDEIFRSVDRDWWSDQDITAYQAICYHYRIENPEVMRNAIFQQDARYQLR